MTYNSYHSNLIIATKYGLIKEGVAERIPASTRSSWKKRDTSRILGYNDELLPPNFEGMVRTMATERKYRIMARGLYRVNQVLNGMLEECSEKKQLIYTHRERIVEAVKGAGEKIGTGKILRWFGITQQQFAYWKSSMKACSLSPLGLCRTRHPHQLLPTEVKKVREYLKDPAFAHWPATSIYYRMVRDGIGNFSKSAFFKYKKLLGIDRPKAEKRRKRKDTGIRASRPFEVLHMDCTVFRPLDHSKVFVHMVVDNFSRAILAHQVSTEADAKTALWNLKKALGRTREHGPGTEKTLIVDDGSENKAEVEDYVMEEETLQKLIAQKEIRFSNSMVERVFQKIKHEGVYHREVEDFQQAVQVFDKEVKDYMERPHGALLGATPEEVMKTGEIGIDEESRDDEAFRRRREWNRKGSCSRC